jgi:Tfp pilus assembly protein PilO
MEQVKRFQVPLLIGVGALVAVVILYMALVAPQGKKLSNLHSSEAKLQAQQTQLQSEIATLKADKAHMASNCARLSKALLEIPGTPDVSTFLNQVTQLAVQTGNPNTPTISVLQAPSGGAASAGGGARPVQVSLTLNGDYGQMISFIKGLDSFPRLFAVTAINVTGGPIAAGGGQPDPATAGYNLNLTGAIFYSVGQQNACQSSSTGPASAG